MSSACTSIDVTKDSKYLLATSVDGVIIFNISDGTKAAMIHVPGNRKLQIQLSYGDKQFFLIYMDKKNTYLAIYDFNTVLNSGTSQDNTPKAVKEINPGNQTEFVAAAWGPLNKTLYVATKTGRLSIIDVSSGTTLKDMQIHQSEIYELAFSHDFTMLFSASRDGTAKLLHPETFETVRDYRFPGGPCRTVAVSPLFDSPEYQKFHMLCAGGQDARDVALTDQGAGGFEIRLFSIIFNEQLAEIHGHFGTVNTVTFSPDGFAFASGGEDGYVHYHRFPPEYFTSDFE